MKKKIVLRRLELKNWRGQNHIVDFNEGTTKISGKNGVGKSSLAKSFYWLLSSFPAPNETRNFNLFDNREELSPDTPKASVKATIQVGDLTYTLEKIAEAKFTKRRGSTDYEKASSDTYTLKVDEIETSATDFNAWIEANICPAEQLVYCLDGGFFTELLQDDKNKARAVLERIVGEITESDMRGDYSILTEDMERYTIDQIEERTKNELKPYKKRAEEIPAIIDDKEKTLAEYESIDFKAILGEIEKTKGEIADIDDAILGKGKEIEPIMGERSRILNLINDKMVAMQKAKNTYLATAKGRLNILMEDLKRVETQNAAIRTRNASKEAELVSTKARLSQMKENLTLLEAKRETLVKERDEIKGRVFEAETCAYCGQELPVDKIEEARAKFNERKESELNNVIARGKNNKEAIEETKKEIARLETIVAEGVVAEELVQTSDIQNEIDREQAALIPFEETEECARLTEEIEALELTLPEVPSNDTSALTEAKKVLMGTLESLNRRYGLKTKAEEIAYNIVELKDELHKVGIHIAHLEGKIDKCKEYKQEKAEIVSYRVNERLVESHIDMFSTLKSGEIVPDVVLRGKDGIKYGSLNFAHQIKTRLEIQKLFCDAMGISVAYWLDEATVISDDNMPVDLLLEEQTILLFANNSPFLTVE